MGYRDRDRAAVWALVPSCAGGRAADAAPALWNGFALLQHDTGGYLARWYEGYLVPSRAVVYGLILNAGVPLGFWPVLLAAAIGADGVGYWSPTLRAHKLARRPLSLLGVFAAMSWLSTLPWLSAILLTDIFWWPLACWRFICC